MMPATPSSGSTFRLRVLRPTRIEGRQLVTGSELDADPVTAFEWVASGRARLLDESDAARLVALVGEARRTASAS